MENIYHLLDEREIFSERNGGAISRWAANALWEGPEVVICPSFDDSWKYSRDRLYAMPGWAEVGQVHPVLYRLPWIFQKAIYLRIFRQLLAKLKPGDVVYVHNRPACAAVLAIVAERYGFGVILHMHNSLLLRANRGQREALRRVPVVYVSKFLRDETELAFPGHFERTHIVYNGANEQRFCPRTQSGASVTKVIFTGRLVPYKGVHVLLKAMQILEKQGVEVSCKIVGGSGFGNSKPTRYVRQLRHDPPANCELVGYRSGEAFSELLQDADIFCCPSIWNDPFPLAPLEAMAAGLPVVASHVGGLPEALAHGGGILVPPNDADALADAIGSLVRDEGRRKQLGLAARQSVERNFCWSNVRAQYLSALQGLES